MYSCPFASVGIEGDDAEPETETEVVLVHDESGQEIVLFSIHLDVEEGREGLEH